MEQNQVQTDLSAFRDPFRYNTFHGFNSHNHIVVTEVGEGTSVVEVEMTQDAMNPLGMAHGGLIFSMCDVATGVAARTGARQQHPVSASGQGHIQARGARPCRQGGPHDRPCDGGGVQ